MSSCDKKDMTEAEKFPIYMFSEFAAKLGEFSYMNRGGAASSSSKLLLLIYNFFRQWLEKSGVDEYISNILNNSGFKGAILKQIYNEISSHTFSQTAEYNVENELNQGSITNESTLVAMLTGRIRGVICFGLCLFFLKNSMTLGPPFPTVLDNISPYLRFLASIEQKTNAQPSKKQIATADTPKKKPTSEADESHKKIRKRFNKYLKDGCKHPQRIKHINIFDLCVDFGVFAFLATYGVLDLSALSTSEVNASKRKRKRNVFDSSLPNEQPSRTPSPVSAPSDIEPKLATDTDLNPELGDLADFTDFGEYINK
jgi:hypothetical protein